jgi:hypothetical protein
MGRGNSIVLDNGKEFTTQKEATEYFKDILNSAVSEVTIHIEHPSFSDLISLYKRHPEFEFKSTCESNVVGFLVKNSGQFNTRCFHALHKDKSIEDWSYPTAIKNKAKTLFECFVDAARYSLENKHPRFRDKSFTAKCRKFIGTYDEDNLLLTCWVSKIDTLQYRSTLNEPYKTQFINWYEEKYIAA